MMKSAPGTGSVMGSHGMMGSAAGAGRMMGGSMMGGSMMGSVPTGDLRLDLAQARKVAQGWLDVTSRGVTVQEAEAFPGYFTFDTARDGATVGMVSVNAATGAVWPHTWHGPFIGSDG